MSRTLYVLRHGETGWNVEGRLQGHRDSPLTASGLEMARAVGALMRRELGRGDGYRVVASPSGRALRTAAIVARAMGRDPADIGRDDRLRELSFGAWEGMTLDQVQRDAPEVWRRFAGDRWNAAAPGGETAAQLSRRVGDWLAGQAADARLIVVCHGGTSRALRGLCLGLDPAATAALPIRHTLVFRLRDGVETRFDAAA